METNLQNDGSLLLQLGIVFVSRMDLQSLGRCKRVCKKWNVEFSGKYLNWLLEKTLASPWLRLQILKKMSDLAPTDRILRKEMSLRWFAERIMDRIRALSLYSTFGDDTSKDSLIFNYFGVESVFLSTLGPSVVGVELQWSSIPSSIGAGQLDLSSTILWGSACPFDDAQVPLLLCPKCETHHEVIRVRLGISKDVGTNELFHPVLFPKPPLDTSQEDDTVFDDYNEVVMNDCKEDVNIIELSLCYIVRSLNLSQVREKIWEE